MRAAIALLVSGTSQRQAVRAVLESTVGGPSHGTRCRQVYIEEVLPANVIGKIAQPTYVSARGPDRNGPPG